MTCARSHALGRGAHGAPSLEHDLSRQRVSSTAPRCSCLPGTHWSPGSPSPSPGPGAVRVTFGSVEHCSSDTSSEGLARGRGGWILAREGTRGRLHPAQPSTSSPPCLSISAESVTLRPRVASSAECGAQSARRSTTTSCPAAPRRSCSSCATVARTQLPGPGLAGGEDTRQLRLQSKMS